MLERLVRSILPHSARRHLLPNYLLSRDVAWESKALFRHYAGARKCRVHFANKTQLQVQIGCGNRRQDGWENLDLQRLAGVWTWDCRRGLPFADNSVSVIFSEHVFEHLDRPRSSAPFLAECLRCLEPGGIIRLVVPDAELYLRAYMSRSWDEMVKARPLVPENGGYNDAWLGERYTTRMEMVNAVFRQESEHKFAYDAETLMLDLRNAGFADVIRQEYGKSLSSTRMPDSPERASESLYVEGRKG